MNRRGFTLTELLATIVILGIVVGFTTMSIVFNIKKSTAKTEEIFIGTITDAIEIYLNSEDVKKNAEFEQVKYNDRDVVINKSHGQVNLYKRKQTVKFQNIIDSDLSPLTASDVKNPANETVACKLETEVEIYRDDDYVYYYLLNKNAFGCFTNNIPGENYIDNYITNLPCEYLRTIFNNVNEGHRCYTE